MKYKEKPRNFKFWFHVQRIFWEILPTLSVYSAMRLLYTIVPTVLLAQITEFTSRRSELAERRANTEKKKFAEHTSEGYIAATKEAAKGLRNDFLKWILLLL